MSEPRNYEAPKITEVGSVEELTLVTFKKFGGTDGIVVNPGNIALGNLSVS